MKKTLTTILIGFIGLLTINTFATVQAGVGWAKIRGDGSRAYIPIAVYNDTEDTYHYISDKADGDGRVYTGDIYTFQGVGNKCFEVKQGEWSTGGMLFWFHNWVTNDLDYGDNVLSKLAVYRESLEYHDLAYFEVVKSDMAPSGTDTFYDGEYDCAVKVTMNTDSDLTNADAYIENNIIYVHIHGSFGQSPQTKGKL